MSFNFCEHCTSGRVLPGEPKGEMRGDAYFSAGPAELKERNKATAIIFLTDIFGLPLKNSKIVADQIAEKAGCDVWIPDQFAGNPIVGPEELDDKIPSRPGMSLPWTAKLSLVFLIITRLHRYLSNRPYVVDTRIKSFVEKLKAEYHYTKLGTVGYCFGGSTAIRLSADPNHIFDSAVIAHPGGGFNLDHIRSLKVPSLWLCAEEDHLFKLKDEAEAVLAARKGKPDYVEYEFIQYKGTVHGFAVRPDLSIPEAKEGFEQAFASTVEWFKKTLDL